MASTRLWTARLSNALRTSTARLLLLGLHAIVLGMALGYLLGWIGLLMATIESNADSKSDGVGPTSSGIGVFMWLVVFSIVYAAIVGPAVGPLISAIRMTRAGGNTHPPGSVRLERTDAPELWSMVAELDAHLRTDMNTRIWLTPHPNAAVAVWPPRGRPRSKTIYLGVPLLAGVDHEELRAILCHELAHCAGRHHSFGVLAHRGSRILHDAGEGLRRALAITTDISTVNRLLRWNTRMLIRLFSCYTVMYDGLTRSARHRQEYEADRIAAQHVGPRLMGRALVRAVEAAEAWEAPRPAAPAKAHPGRMTLHELAQSLSDAPPTDTDQRTRRRRGKGTPSHPTPEKRLAALGVDQTRDLERAGVPSLRLLPSTTESTEAQWPELPHPASHSLTPSTPARGQSQPVRLKRPLIAIAVSLAVFACVTNVAESWNSPHPADEMPPAVPTSHISPERWGED
ncbi:M48 family metalloprotease (plasmid) [Streptomyces sp. QH1-20]|uniref:M48 family metalloprotease n=1 Tax=Streptomyces sp. QH1-20 TaxID=3240934 RepID=UPI00351368B8